MSGHFSWQTDEDGEWDELLSQPPPPPPPRRLWLWGLILFAAATLIPFIIYQRLQKQVELATTQAREEVLAAHSLSQTAAANQDTDLFRSNLSRHDPYWADVQRELVSRGRFHDRSAFGLQWWAASAVNQANPTEPISLTLSPDLLSAELIYEQEYQLPGSPAEAISTSPIIVTLHHTVIYRRSENRWLRADPLDEFWGTLEEIEHEYLTLQYNSRDAALAPRLAADLNEQLALLCQTFTALACDELHLTLLLSRNPDYFFTILDLEDVLTTDDILRLPSPTLVGLPQDDLGYELLRDGYAVPLVSLALARLTGYQCCHHGLFFRALLDKALLRLDLSQDGWPLTPESYATLDPDAAAALVIAAWDEETVFWGQNEARLPVYSLIDFLTEVTRPRLDLTYWQSSLRPDMTYWSWISPRLVTPTSPSLFLTRWLGYMQQQQQPLPPPPIRLPDGDIQLSCLSDGATTFHYRPASNTWTETPQISAVFQTFEEGYLIQSLALPHSVRSLIMVRNGQSTVITSTRSAEIFYGASVPEFASTLTYPWLHFTSYNVLARTHQDWLVNLDECKNGDCVLRPRSGSPIFAPDGQNMLLAVDLFGDGQLYDFYLTTPLTEEARQVGRGYNAFWLDADHYGFFYDFSNRTELYVGQKEGGTPQRVLTDSDLSDFFPVGNNEAAYRLNRITLRPQHDHETLLWLTYTGLSQHELVFHLTWDENWQTILETKLVWDGEHTLPGFSPDGHFYLLQQLTELDRAFMVHEVTTGVRQIYPWGNTEHNVLNTPFWVEDGQWLIHINDTTLTLIAPHQEYVRSIPIALTGCNHVIYLPPGEPPDWRGR